jgi:NAD-dependent dihydropyrimidine dehydrogenase PreA subunit
MGTLSYRQVRVGSHLVGLVGLEELFSQLKDAGRPAEAALVPELLAGARQHNYIPATAEALYGEALLQAYRRYLSEQAAGGRTGKRSPTWRGVPREQIPWFPTLYADRCDGCGRCLSFCPEGVFAPTSGGDRVEVVEPLACQVGCSACAAVCPRGAIVFPPRTVLEAVGAGR